MEDRNSKSGTSSSTSNWEATEGSSLGTSGSTWGTERTSSSGGRAGSSNQSWSGSSGQGQSGTDQVLNVAAEKAGQLTDQASTALDEGIDKAAVGLDRAADMVRERGQQMGDNSGVQSSTAMVAEKLDAAAVYLRDRDSGQLMADLEELVRQKPAQSLLVAAGVGFLVSKILR